MTTLEEEFYKTFGIEKLPLDCDKCGAMRFGLGQCADTDCKRVYPPITSDILLELICIANTQGKLFQSDNINDLEDEILSYFIELYKEFTNDEIGKATKEELKQQIKGLFEEE